MCNLPNIRHTHFSRNPKIAAFLKAYHFVKEYGEGVDRMCRELEVNGSTAPVFHTDDFILKVTVAKVTEKVANKLQKVTEKARNIEAMRGKYLRRVGPDKGGFWEVIE